jgi:hypothetical protein
MSEFFRRTACLALALCFVLLVAAFVASTAEAGWCEDECSFVCDICKPASGGTHTCCVGCACEEGETFQILIFEEPPAVDTGDLDVWFLEQMNGVEGDGACGASRASSPV